MRITPELVLAIIGTVLVGLSFITWPNSDALHKVGSLLIGLAVIFSLL